MGRTESLCSGREKGAKKADYVMEDKGAGSVGGNSRSMEAGSCVVSIEFGCGLGSGQIIIIDTGGRSLPTVGLKKETGTVRLNSFLAKLAVNGNKDAWRQLKENAEFKERS